MTSFFNDKDLTPLLFSPEWQKKAVEFWLKTAKGDGVQIPEPKGQCEEDIRIGKSKSHEEVFMGIDTLLKAKLK